MSTGRIVREDALLEQAATGAEHHAKRHETEAIDPCLHSVWGAGRFPDLQLVAGLVFSAR